MQLQSMIDGLQRIAECNPSRLFESTDTLKSIDLGAGPFHVSIFLTSPISGSYRSYSSLLGYTPVGNSVMCTLENLNSVIKAGCYTEAAWYAVEHAWPEEDIAKLAAVRKQLRIEVKR